MPRSDRELAAVWAYPRRSGLGSRSGSAHANTRQVARERSTRRGVRKNAPAAASSATMHGKHSAASTRTGADVLLDAAGQRRSERSPGRAALRTGRCACRGARSDAVAGQAGVYRHRVAPAVGECRRMVVGRPVDRRRFRPPCLWRAWHYQSATRPSPPPCPLEHAYSVGGCSETQWTYKSIGYIV